MCVPHCHGASLTLLLHILALTSYVYTCFYTTIEHYILHYALYCTDDKFQTILGGTESFSETAAALVTDAEGGFGTAAAAATPPLLAASTNWYSIAETEALQLRTELSERVQDRCLEGM
jgi:hypothetical protein